MSSEYCSEKTMLSKLKLVSIQRLQINCQNKEIWCIGYTRSANAEKIFRRLCDNTRNFKTKFRLLYVLYFVCCRTIDSVNVCIIHNCQTTNVTQTFSYILCSMAFTYFYSIIFLQHIIKVLFSIYTIQWRFTINIFIRK